jgi:hypothetical protein
MGKSESQREVQLTVLRHIFMPMNWTFYDLIWMNVQGFCYLYIIILKRENITLYSHSSSITSNNAALKGEELESLAQEHDDYYKMIMDEDDEQIGTPEPSAENKPPPAKGKEQMHTPMGQKRKRSAQFSGSNVSQPSELEKQLMQSLAKEEKEEDYATLCGKQLAIFMRQFSPKKQRKINRKVEELLDEFDEEK